MNPNRPPRIALPILLPIALICLGSASALAQTAEEGATLVLEATIEQFSEFFRDLGSATQDIYGDFFGEGAGTQNLDHTVGALGYPDITVAREDAVTGARDAIEPEDLSSTPTVLAAIVGSTVTNNLIEQTLNYPLSADEQERLQQVREDHLAYLQTTIENSLFTAETSYDITEQAFSVDLSSAIQSLESLAQQAQNRDATQDVLKDMALMFPQLGELQVQQAQILQLISNQTALLNYATFYNAAILGETQDYLGQLALEAKLDRAIQSHLLLEQARALESEQLADHVDLQADGVGLVELSGSLGFGREVP